MNRLLLGMTVVIAFYFFCPALAQTGHATVPTIYCAQNDPSVPSIYVRGVKIYGIKP
jgi:hypothetical protein